MKDHFPEGFDKRSRSAVNKTAHTAILQSYGPNEQLSIDGHDKLSAIGFPIYGMRDKFSRKWMVLVAAPSNRTNLVTSYLYLKLVQTMKGMVFGFVAMWSIKALTSSIDLHMHKNRHTAASHQ